MSFQSGALTALINTDHHVCHAAFAAGTYMYRMKARLTQRLVSKFILATSCMLKACMQLLVV